MASIDSGIAEVEKAIARVEQDLIDVDKRIVEAEPKLDSLKNQKRELGQSDEDKLAEQRLDVQIQEYRDRLQHLRKKEEALRKKEEHLRTEKEQLREKQQLRTKEPSAHATALDAERQRDQQGSASTWSASRIGGYLGCTTFIMMLAVLKMLYSIMSKSVTQRPTWVVLLKCCAEQGTWPLTTVGTIAGVWTALPIQKLVDLAQPLAKLGTAWAAGLQSQLRGGRLAPLLAISPPATVASFLWSAAVAAFVAMLMPFIWKAAGD
ncbi:hypothetical protein HXX76_014223 [Chlamydomonas incerta]|uniref:Uncharacterized protein n=1 Tax=Chlamydomonas incerta TaxID=51695 RepID=A0A835SQ73_CHLIN|nr:hypothetical protein HXX76_014223 [Chlamydomonas incerta]|eukprot:KAG2424800.1 hypothetical protein HXX76_014223 [Chlamydomonas incerta]